MLMIAPLVHIVAAARPNFMKVAPLWHELARERFCTPFLVHTGQHYDASMSGVFFKQLKLPQPDADLGVRASSHAVQTAQTMITYEQALLAKTPELVVVVGDVNGTLACALTARKMGLRVAHLEAGLRSHDRTMPEELNRVATDAISDVLWTPSEDADENLRREGHTPLRIRRVGNIMIDSFEMLRPEIEAAAAAGGPSTLYKGQYAVLTLHRPTNVDDPETLGHFVRLLPKITALLPVVFPIHPRTKRKLDEFGLADTLGDVDGLIALDPLSYVDFMALVLTARLIITDSGGVQEETTHLDIPCLTLRANTERPVTVSMGTNKLVSLDELVPSVGDALTRGRPKGSRPRIPLWDGHTATRVADHIRELIA
jgi:UDP-N-acetylglucosamine 2-epimerase (non-hydrolysing)